MSDHGDTARIVAVLTSGTLAEFAAQAKRLEAEHGPRLVLSMAGFRPVVRTPGPVCWCATCEDRDAKDWERLTGEWSLSRSFIVCPECGNKRCPRASHHAHECTGSNESGQRGSYYGERCEHMPPPEPLDPETEAFFAAALERAGLTTPPGANT